MGILKQHFHNFLNQFQDSFIQEIHELHEEEFEFRRHQWSTGERSPLTHSIEEWNNLHQPTTNQSQIN
jgi:hypothetical protein